MSPHHDSSQPITLTAASLATLCAVLWGGLAVAVRFTQADIPPLATAGLRFSTATALLAATVVWQGASLAISRRQLAAVLPVGLVLFIQIGSFHFGMARTNSAHGSVLIGSYPVFVALVAHFAMHGDRLSPMKLVGLLVAFLGLLAVLGAGAASSENTDVDAVTLGGDAIILGSSFLIGVNTVMSKRALSVIGVPQLLFWSNLLATGLFFVGSSMTEAGRSWRFTPDALGGLAYQGIVVAWLCFLLWTALLGRHRASQVAVFGFAQPLCGMFFGAWLRGDPLTAELGFGALAVAAGIVLVTRADREA
ncbi:MAG TPA: DMT family transporter [Pirellulales bacterium]